MAKKDIPWTKAELRRPGAVRTFAGEQLREIAFPLGGLGAGCISLGGWGQLRDWEIYNAPGKGNRNHYAFFTLWARPRGREGVCKVLQGPVQAPFDQGGHGFYRESGSGLPHFRQCRFTGAYPFATVSLRDRQMPLRAELTAWNPFIPLNDRDSSIPCAIFEWTLTNPTARTVDATLFMNLTNTIGHPEVGRGLIRFRREGRLRGLELTTRKHPKTSPRYGTMALVTPGGKVTHLNHWLRSGWFDACTDFWAQVETGRLDESVRPSVSPDGRADTGSIGVRLTLGPRESKTIPLILAWHVPNIAWSAPHGKAGVAWKAYHAAQWKDAWSVAAYVASHLARLRRETRLYADTLEATTLPGAVVEAVSATSSILKSPTCLRWTDGSFWAWEGCHDQAGCCPGTCTHVWNYQQMMPFLFPALERNIRETDYAYNLRRDGAMGFRMPLPLGTQNTMGAAADGQFGGIMKVYREWRISGDDAWLRRLWPAVRKALEFAWVELDADRDGVMEGMQHNTYDIEFWGPNTLCGSFYLGALRAGEEMARHLGDDEAAATYRDLFERGSRWTDENLFNGRYYVQKVNPRAGAGKTRDLRARGKLDGNWPKYQYGSGCLSDQLLGQLLAEILELGDLYSARNIDRAADSIFRHNFRTEFFDHANPQRIYAMDDEPGLILCSWPEGGKERFPFPYAEEVWTGIEYATAALLACRGRIDEALAIVRAVRERYDGRYRNPYDEVECGHHYARAMASYAVLLALAGFAADMPKSRLKFAPRINAKDFATFFAVDSGWGLYTQTLAGRKSAHALDVRYGSVKLKRLALGRAMPKTLRASLGGRRVAATAVEADGGIEVVLSRAVTVRPAAPLKVAMS